jgi:hypothetical protein
VVIDIAEYRSPQGGGPDFKAFLRSAPDVDLEIDRSPASTQAAFPISIRRRSPSFEPQVRQGAGPCMNAPVRH